MGDYNKFAEEYARETAKLEKETRTHFYSLLPDSLEGRIILDVGCGSGHDAGYYAKKGAKVYGVDISEKEIQMAKNRKCGEFSVANMDNLPYDSNTFDIITSVYALQASDDVPTSLREMIRVVKPNSPIIILTKHPFRNLLEGHINDKRSNYYAKRAVTSRIFNRTIKLNEPGHTMMDYLDKGLLKEANLELFEEHTDFPASEQIIPGLVYPTYMILGYRKK